MHVLYGGLKNVFTENLMLKILNIVTCCMSQLELLFVWTGSDENGKEQATLQMKAE